jgi:hypothetical protein
MTTDIGPPQLRTVEGIDYSYPPAELGLDAGQIEAMCKLPSSHAVGDMVLLEADQERFPGQGAFCVESPLPDTDTMMALGEVVHPGYGKFIESVLGDNHMLRRLRRVGEKLEAGRNVAHAIFHGPLLDDGLAHGAMVVALKVLRYDFQAAMIVSGGTAGLGLKLRGENVPEGTMLPVTNGLNTACDKLWHTIPRTDNARESDFGRLVTEEQIKGWNDLTVGGIGSDLDEGGWLFTILPDGSTHKLGPDGEYVLFNPGRRTLEMMAHRGTYVQAAGGRFQDRDQPLYGLFGDLRRLSRFERLRLLQGDAMMLDMAAGASALVPDEEFRVEPPRRVGSFAVGMLRHVDDAGRAAG